MGKLRVLSGNDGCNILEKHGFVEVRRRGSRIAMLKKMPIATVTVPVPEHKELRAGTLMAIIRQSGLSRSEFE